MMAVTKTSWGVLRGGVVLMGNSPDSRVAAGAAEEAQRRLATRNILKK